MRRFLPRLRFSLRALLALPLVFVIWFWATWPNRTFNRFVNALVDGRYRYAATLADGINCELVPMVTDLACHVQNPGNASSYFHFPADRVILAKPTASLADLCQSRNVRVVKNRSGAVFTITVIRGRIEVEVDELAFDRLAAVEPVP